MEAKWTPGPWELRKGVKDEDAALLKIPEHERYSRDNEGGWRILTKPDNKKGDFKPVGVATFQGKAKRGEAYRAIDPEGMANARLLAAAPEMAESLARVTNRLERVLRGVVVRDADEVISEARILLAKINRGE